MVIPVYGELASLLELVNRIDQLFESLEKQHDIVLVDDCGPSERWTLLQEL